MYARTALPNQFMIIEGLSHVIDQTCQGTYAISKHHIGEGNLVFGKVKPLDVPRLIRLGVEPGYSSYIDFRLVEGRGAFRKSPFYEEVQIIQGISNRATKFVKGFRRGEREVRRVASSLAERAENASYGAQLHLSVAKSLAEKATDFEKSDVGEKLWHHQREQYSRAVREFSVSAHSSIMSGMLFASIDGSEERMRAQEYLLSGARDLSRIGMPIAGATAAMSAAALAMPWNRVDDRIRQLKREAGRMWSQSLTTRDRASELDRVFLGLVSAPENQYLRLLLIKLIYERGESGDVMGMAGGYLRLALAIAKSENPNFGDWNRVKTCVDRALKAWWSAHEIGEIDIDEIYPEVVVAEEIAIMAGALELHGVVRHYAPLVDAKNQEHELGRIMRDYAMEEFAKQYVRSEI